MTTQSAQSYFTTKEAAAYLRCSVETIKAAVHDGRLLAKKTGPNGGGPLRFSRAALDGFFEAMSDA